VRKTLRNFRNVSLGILVAVTISGCATSSELEDLNNDLEELDQLNDELDDALTDLDNAIDDFDAFAACMEMWDYNPPEGTCE
jgi:prefoldin subunit 5